MISILLLIIMWYTDTPVSIMIILISLCPAASTKHTTVHVCSQVCYFCKNCLTVFDCFIFLLIHLHYFSLNTFNRLFCFPVGMFFCGFDFLIFGFVKACQFLNSENTFFRIYIYIYYLCNNSLENQEIINDQYW